MSSYERLLAKILSGKSDANISFINLCQLLKKLGFDERTRGDHHIFTKAEVEEILNLQPKDAKAKPYQVRQVRNIVISYRINLEKSDED
jgi:hypothetical protein